MDRMRKLKVRFALDAPTTSTSEAAGPAPEQQQQLHHQHHTSERQTRVSGQVRDSDEDDDDNDEVEKHNFDSWSRNSSPELNTIAKCKEIHDNTRSSDIVKFVVSNNYSSVGSEPGDFIKVNLTTNQKGQEFVLPRKATGKMLYDRIRDELNLTSRFQLVHFQHSVIKDSHLVDLWGYNFRHRPNHIAIYWGQLNRGDNLKLQPLGVFENCNGNHIPRN